MRTLATFGLAFALSFPVVPAAAQDVPAELNHEGLLLDGNGLPMEGHAGLRIGLYQAPEGGDPDWFEDYQLQLVDGYYNVRLGSQAPGLHAALLGGGRYLGVTLNGDELLPRHPLSSVPFAQVAETVVGAVDATTVSVGGQLVIDADGVWRGQPIGGGGGGGDGYSTPQEVLAALITVDGEGTGLDADRLDGLEGTAYLQVANLLTAIREVDGDRSQIDADRLDGLDSSDFPRTGEEILAELADSDGAGSGLDADALDGLQPAHFMRADQDTGTVGSLLVVGNVTAADPVLPQHLATMAWVQANGGGGGNAGGLEGKVCPEGFTLRGYAADGTIQCSDVRPRPFLRSVQPGGGGPGGATDIVLLGGNYLPGAQVFVGATPAANVVVVDQGRITATTAATLVPKGGAPDDVFVLNPNGRWGALRAGYTYSDDVDGDEVPNLADCGPLDPGIFPDNPDGDPCDGQDNDCDGALDEDFLEQECATGLLGVCSAGTAQCDDGVGRCVQDVQASDEVCDREDNDCDGEIDEGLADCAAWGDPIFVREIMLDPAWSDDTDSNFHPQSLSWYPATGGLSLVMQSQRRIDILDLNGNRTNTVAVAYHHMTGHAADGENFFFTDYSGNAGGYDLFRVPIGGGGVTRISDERAAYGGFPLTLWGDTMWRTTASNTYNWDNLRTIRVSSKANPDAVTSSFNIGVARGIGDLCHDGESLWMLGNTRSRGAQIDLYRLDAATGAVLETHTSLRACGNRIPSGLACTDNQAGNLWVFCYQELSSDGSSIVEFRR